MSQKQGRVDVELARVTGAPNDVINVYSMYLPSRELASAPSACPRREASCKSMKMKTDLTIQSVILEKNYLECSAYSSQDNRVVVRNGVPGWCVSAQALWIS